MMMPQQQQQPFVDFSASESPPPPPRRDDNRMRMLSTMTWQFVKAQLQMMALLFLIVRPVNDWSRSYPRNENHHPSLFRFTMVLVGLVALATLQKTTALLPPTDETAQTQQDGAPTVVVVVDPPPAEVEVEQETDNVLAEEPVSATEELTAGQAPTTRAEEVEEDEEAAMMEQTITAPNVTFTATSVMMNHAETEEWKGIMICYFALYLYYRMYTVYNQIRVLVSTFIW